MAARRWLWRWPFFFGVQTLGARDDSPTIQELVASVKAEKLKEQLCP
jgi:hypothetical protein